MNEAKKYLMQIRLLDTKIRHMQNYVDELRGMLTDTGGTDYSKVRVKTSPPQDVIAERIIKIADMEAKIDREIDKLIETRDRIVWEISRLDEPDEITVLELRYVQQMKWDMIAEQMHYSIRRVYQIHGDALKSFAYYCSKLH